MSTRSRDGVRIAGRWWSWRVLSEAESTIPAIALAKSDQDVLAAIDGISREAFIALDEIPGFFGYKYCGVAWHHRLRHARNNPDNNLFDRLT